LNFTYWSVYVSRGRSPMTSPFHEYKGIVKTVHASKLEECTRQGWVVVDAFDEQNTEAVYGVEPRVLPHGPNDYSHEATVSTTHHHLVTSRYFVVRVDDASHLAGLNEQIAGLKTTLDEKSVALTQAQEALRKTSRDLDTAQLDVTSLRSAAGRMAEDRQAEILKMRRMEDDLGKLRKALGELRVREILGEAT
jgi:hypothetical protein